MISKRFSILIFFITVSCGLVFSADDLRSRNLTQNSEISSISLSELLSTFRRTHHDTVDTHLSFMFWVASYGDRLYSLSADLSAECSRTARANSLMLGKLAICEEAFDVMLSAVDNVTRDLKNRTELKEHPLELLCRRIEKRYAEESTLSLSFEKARKDAANFENVSHSPPYFQEIIKTEELVLKLIEKLDVPELAKLIVLTSIRTLLRGRPQRTTFFVRSCRAVAKKEKFADSMQNIFEKAVNDVLPEIMVDDRVQKYTSSLKSEPSSYGLWWVPNMMKLFYGYIAKDPILKKEVEDVSSIINKGAREEDLDFSKL